MPRKRHKPVEIVEDLQPAPAAMAWIFDQNFIAHLGNVDGYQHGPGGYRI